MTNPYQPSLDIESDSVGRVKRPKMWPALLLLVLLVPTFLYDALVAWAIALDFLNASRAIGWSPSMVGNWRSLIQCGAIFSAHCAILVGAICMWQYRAYRLSMLACLLSLIPLLSPSLILGIPAAMWGLAMLSRASVRASFARNDAA